MKVMIAAVLVFSLLILLIPMVALRYPQRESGAAPVHQPYSSIQDNMEKPLSGQGESTEETGKTPDNPESTQSSIQGTASFKIYNLSTEQVEEVAYQDYIRGAVAAEMLPGFHSEALKAQAVAAHTYALHQHYLQSVRPDPALQGADFAADPSNRTGYVTIDQVKDLYGEQFEYYWTKICDAADSVSSYVMTYEQEPIVAAYHAMSAGSTEDAQNVWGNGAPYLKAVLSEGDIYAPDYHTTLSLSVDDAKEKLLAAYPDLELPENPTDWFESVIYSDSGYILSVTVGGRDLSGGEIRQLFGLRSHNADITCDGQRITFDVYGYGHGVGMSQYGADFLARQGKTFDEILETYYTGAELSRIVL